MTGKAATVDTSIPVMRVELPTYYLVFILLVILLVVWGIIKIFGHAEHSHDQEH
jgi:hypothetical protein